MVLRPPGSDCSSCCPCDNILRGSELRTQKLADYIQWRNISPMMGSPPETLPFAATIATVMQGWGIIITSLQQKDVCQLFSSAIPKTDGLEAQIQEDHSAHVHMCRSRRLPRCTWMLSLQNQSKKLFQHQLLQQLMSSLENHRPARWQQICIPFWWISEHQNRSGSSPSNEWWWASLESFRRV